MPVTPTPRCPRPAFRGDRRVAALSTAALVAVIACPAQAETPGGGAAVQPPMLRCLLPALYPDILSRCFGGTNPSYRTYAVLGASFARDTREVLTRYDYTDLKVGTPQLTVWTPLVTAAVEAPNGRWGVNVSMAVDVVSRASADLVTSASRTDWTVRHAPSVGGHGRFGDVDVNLRGSLSYRSDALSVSAGGGISVDFLQRTVVPSLDYTFAHEDLGGIKVPFSVRAHRASRHTIEARATIMLDEATLFLPTFALTFEEGDTSVPYRHIPMFWETSASDVPAGATVKLVNSQRLAADPFEQLPTKRLQVAPGVLLAHRFAWSTLRVEERLSAESWTVMSTNTSVQWVIDAGARVRLWPDVRVYAQRGADFWRRAYTASRGPDGWLLPMNRTARIDLGPLVTLTSGAGVRVALDERKRFSVIVNGGVDYTRFLDHLYVTHRIGPFGTVALEADVQ